MWQYFKATKLQILQTKEDKTVSTSIFFKKEATVSHLYPPMRKDNEYTSTENTFLS